MSDQHSYGGDESLGKESRSVDSESAGRSHRDFFSEHPDDAAAREIELVDDKPLVQADVLTSEQSSVPPTMLFALKTRRYEYIQSKETLMNCSILSVLLWVILILKYAEHIVGTSFVLYVGVLLMYFIKQLAVNLLVVYKFIGEFKTMTTFFREPELWYATALTILLGLNYFGVVYRVNMTWQIVLDCITGGFYTIMSVVVFNKYDAWKIYIETNYNDIDDWALTSKL